MFEIDNAQDHFVPRMYLKRFSLPDETDKVAVAIRAFLAKELDDPEIELENQGAGSWKIWQNLKVEDSALGSPFLFCLSREPATKSDWERLRAALPERYDTWTVTERCTVLRRREVGWRIHTIQPRQATTLAN